MCSNDVRQIIVDVINEHVVEEIPFTAFDITKEVRTRTIEKVSHRDVRREVEAFWNVTITYRRELVSLNVDGSPKAYIYAHHNKSVYDHPLAIEEEDSIEDEEEDTVDDSEEVVVKATSENRLNIPKKILNKVSPVGGSYDISINGTLIPRKPTSDDRIRIGLTKLGIRSGKYKIEIDDNSNVIQIKGL